MTISVVFAGSPAIAVPYLRELVAAGLNVVQVITRPDSPQGRKKEITPTPVAVFASEHRIPVLKTTKLKDAEIANCDIGLIVAFGAKVPESLLNKPKHGWVNVHFSILPKYRGASPLQRSMLEGSQASGVSIFKLVEELDAGPLYKTVSKDFLPNETASEALERFSDETAALVLQTLDDITNAGLAPVEQTGIPSSASKFSSEDGKIDWKAPGEAIDRLIRAVTAEPGAYSFVNEMKVKILRARLSEPVDGNPGEIHSTKNSVIVSTGSGKSIELLEVQPSGKQAMSAISWIRGLREAPSFK